MEGDRRSSGAVGHVLAFMSGPDLVHRDEQRGNVSTTSYIRPLANIHNILPHLAGALYSVFEEGFSSFQPKTFLTVVKGKLTSTAGWTHGRQIFSFTCL